VRLTEDAEQRLLADVAASPRAHLILGPVTPPQVGIEPYVRADGSILIYRDGLAERLHRRLFRIVVDPELGRRRIVPSCGVWGCQNPLHFALSEHGSKHRPDGEEPVERPHRAPDAAARNARRTTCPQHHPYSPENTYVWKDPQGREHRACRACRDARRALTRGVRT
jgi:hypothetical protein